jgi:hypothetical protein
MQDGWMYGWMGGVDKKHFFIIFYPHTNYPHASTYLPTYLPTYLVATRVRWVLEIAPNPPPPPSGIKVDNHDYEKNQIPNFYL